MSQFKPLESKSMGVDVMGYNFPECIKRLYLVNALQKGVPLIDLTYENDILGIPNN